MVKVFPALRNYLSPSFAIATSLLVGGALLATVPASAAVQQAPQFGVVDVRRVLSESKSNGTTSVELQVTQRNYAAILQRLDQGSARFLTEAEINELATLYEKAKPTAVEQKRISQLEEKGDQQKREMTALQNTPKPDEAQTARFTLLSDAFEKGRGSLRQLSQTLSARLEDKVRDAEQKSLVAVRVAVAKVAKAKGLAVVFTSDTVFYATNDITDEVVKEVNK